MRRYFALIIALSFLFAGNTGKIIGKVTDESTGSPLIGANVILAGTTIGTATGVQGEYLLLNVPVGTYDVEVKMIGYATVISKDVGVSADLTTKLDVKLRVSHVAGEVIEVIGEKPNIQMDMTSSQSTVSGGEMMILPVEDIDGAIALSAGVVQDDGNMHFRGGRGQEVVYLFDGISLNDPLTGNPNDSNVPMLAVSELDVITGGFSAEYGDAQSGVINVSGSEGTSQFSSTMRYTTSNFISDGLNDNDPEDLRKLEFMLAGPLYKNMATFSFSGDINEDYGRFSNQFQDLTNLAGKVTFKPSDQLKFHVSGLYSLSNLQNGYDHEWIQNVSEDMLTDYVPSYVDGYDGRLDEIKNGVVTFSEIPDLISDGNTYRYSDWWSMDGIQSEDSNSGWNGDGDGVLDMFYESEPFTDWNGNGQWDFVDLNGNGIMDSEDPREDFEDINGDGIYSANINLDVDGDGDNRHEDLNNNYVLDVEGVFDSWYGNGILDTEDLNFNGVLDDGEDLNGDGYIQSEDVDRDGNLTVYNMFERQPWWEQESNLITAGLNYTISPRSYINFTIARYTTEMTTNIIERLNEDRNYNGILDDGEDLNGNAVLDSYSSSGNVWEVGDGQDMFHDRNNDDIVDESYWDHDGDGDIDEDDYITWDQMMGSVSRADKSLGFYTIAANSPYTFNRDHWHYDKKVTNTFKLDFVSQFDDHNKLHTGFEFKQYDLTNHDTPDRYGYAELYTVKPKDFSAFISDKMEYTELGLIVNAGIRFEYFEASEAYPANEADPTWSTEDFADWDGDGWPQFYNSALDEYGYYIHGVGDIKDPIEDKGEWKIAPRLGISHPISDHSMLYFNYGRNYQRPRLDYLFRNRGYNMGGGFPIVGNPTLAPELTVSYEFGVRNEIRKNLVFEFKGFYKDIFGLTDTRPVYWTVSDWYSTYFNRDYGNVRGTEMVVSLRPPGLFFGNLNYTYSIAKGKSSDWRQGYLNTWAGSFIPTWESYLEWDQRHTINADLNIAYLNTLTTLVINYGSGTRYTRPGQGKEEIENTETFPWTLYSDFKFNYFLQFGNVKTTFFVSVSNLFDRENIRGVADTEWYHTYTMMQEAYDDGDMHYFDYMSQMDLDRDGKVDLNKKNPEMGSDLDPSVYADSRRFRIGVSFEL